MPVCEECGSHDVERKYLYGLLVEECGLCDHLQGGDHLVAKVLERRQAEALGIPSSLLGLLEVLDGVPGLAIERKLSMTAGAQMPPAIFFHLRSKGLEVLDRLARSLVLACRQTSTLWTVEATHQARLLFVLRPRLFHSADELTAAEEKGLQGDLKVLRESLERDIQLPWWELPEA